MAAFTYFPSAGEERQEDAGGWLDSWSTQLSELHDSERACLKK